MDADEHWMGLALSAAAEVRATAHPNPWVGAVVVSGDELVASGATQPPGRAHAEVEALRSAGDRARGATVYVTLEPCSHHGRTPPCAEALIEAQVGRVVIGLEDPDGRVAGRGASMLREAGIDVTVGVCAADVRRQLRPYLHHRTTGRPYVVLKMASTLDGRTAAADGSSRWITGSASRSDAHRLRAESDVIVVGAGTVRADDPALDVRHVEGPNPERLVLGSAPAGARCQPCTEFSGPVTDLVEELGARGVVQVLVEGGADVAGQFQRHGLVDRYVLYLAPALMGGDDGRGVFAGPGAATIDACWRGRIDSVTTLDGDLRIDLVAEGSS